MSTSRTTLSVVIPFYNDAYIEEAVESALAQTAENVEIIVVNDGSTRETERLTRYQGRILVLNQANGGTASALNHGFRSASGAYVAWLSSDDRWLPSKLSKQMAFMEQTGASISHTAFRYMDERGQIDPEPIRLSLNSMSDFYRTLLHSNTVNGCTVMMRRSLFHQLGGFNEWLRYTHDYDFWLRAILAGYPILYMDEALTEYRRHPEMGTILHQEDISPEFLDVNHQYKGRLEQLLTALSSLSRLQR